jgi:hypothetical protein
MLFRTFRPQSTKEVKSHGLRPKRTRISCLAAFNAVTEVVLLNENHILLTEAASLNWKSGVA